MKRVFLSASFPSGERGARVAPYYPSDIAAVAATVAEATMRAGARLVFGGHPTISPIVLHVAGLLAAGPQVEIWQSRWFENSITTEVHRLVEQEHAVVRWTDREDDLSSTLLQLRTQMFEPGLAIAFFVGGMEGIREEYDMVSRLSRTPSLFAFSAPGGMSARLEGGGELKILSGRAYGSLTLEALASAGITVEDNAGEI